MDLTRFSDPDFDVKEWVNGALRAHKDPTTPLDAYASTLVMKLQLFIQEVNSTIEETSAQIVQGLPKVLRDVESVRQEAQLLKEQMTVVKEDIKLIESNTAHSMKVLVEVDSMKTKMVASQRALQEADNWTTLSADVEDVFASQDLQKISTKLVGMQQSLTVLHDVPDFEDRKRLLESLKNRLEALLTPKLMSAFYTRSVDEVKRLAIMFCNMGRSSQLQSYYIANYKGEIGHLWFHDTTMPFLPSLSHFYDELLSKWHSEYSWCSEVFPDEAVSTLSMLFCQSLEGLGPPLSSCLARAVETSTNPLETFAELRQAACRFVKSLEKTLNGLKDLSAVYGVVEMIHTPYCQLLVHYPTMEAQVFCQKLKTLELGNLHFSADTLTNTAAHISGTVPKVFIWASEALERCVQITEVWGLSGLLKQQEVFFSLYCDQVENYVKSMRLECGLDIKGGGGGEAGMGKQEEWSHLHSALHLLESCGNMLLRSSQLNAQLCSTVVSHAPFLRSPASPSNPFGSFPYLSTYYPDEHTNVMELLASVEEGGGELPLLASVTRRVQLLNEKVQMFAFDTLFSRMRKKLSSVPLMKVWAEGMTSPLESPRPIVDDLPSFSLSPLSYITEVGDYLLTLPQQLEPFSSQDNPGLMAALKVGYLPGQSHEEPVEGNEEHMSGVWLEAIAKATVDLYIHSILRIPVVINHTAQQLAADIGYFTNVLAAIGHVPSEQLSQLATLYGASKERIEELRTKKDSVTQQLCSVLLKQRTWQ
ncbi:hypothetical protein EMCRGX_G020132 [Ephydatia muelleri]